MRHRHRIFFCDPTRPGNVPPTRTPTGCYVSTFPRHRPVHPSLADLDRRRPPNSTTRPRKVLNWRTPAGPSNSYSRRVQYGQVLQPLIEPKDVRRPESSMTRRIAAGRHPGFSPLVFSSIAVDRRQQFTDRWRGRGAVVARGGRSGTTTTSDAVFDVGGSPTCAIGEWSGAARLLVRRTRHHAAQSDPHRLPGALKHINAWHPGNPPGIT